MSCNRIIRNANQDDGCIAVPLLFYAGKHLLTEIFGQGDSQVALAYLFAAWRRGSGQYGCENHWVVEINGKVTGLISCWHDRLPENFDKETLTSIVEHFGIDDALEIVMHSQRYLAVLEGPLYTELGIGHLAVSSDVRRQGVGSALIEFMQEKATAMKKNALVLNCETANQDAIAFYQRLGFGIHRTSGQFVQMIKALPIETK